MAPRKKQETPEPEQGGGFWDEYVEVGGNFIKADEKQVLMEQGIPMVVQGVIEDQANKYGPRYVANVLVPNPESGEEEERSISFPIGTVESRDRMLAQMMTYLGRADAAEVKVRLEQVGRSIIIRQA